MGYDIALGLITGISLSAACGFRVFVPFLVLSITALTGQMDLSPSYEWVTSFPAVLAFSVATAAEIAGYYIPWIDNALDTISTPLTIIAGTLATGMMFNDVNPLLEWVVSIVAGGGTALVVQLITVKARALSSLFTGGTANPLLSTFENFSSFAISLIAIIAAPVALTIIILIVVYIVRRNRKKERARTLQTELAASRMQ